MGLIDWKNLPNTETPITAENIKNDTSYLNQKFTNPIISNTERITDGTAWTSIEACPITLPKGKYIVVATIVGIPNDAMIAITNTDASTICIKGNSFSGRENIVDIVSFNSPTTIKINFTPSANFSNINLSCSLKAIKVSD